MTCNFSVGQKVICIADYSPAYDEEWAVAFNLQFPERGQVYTIRDLILIRHPDSDYAVGLRLTEIVNPPCPRAKGGGWTDSPMEPDEIAFDPVDFRPLVSTKTGMSLFNSILVSSKTKVGV